VTRTLRYCHPYHRDSLREGSAIVITAPLTHIRLSDVVGRLNAYATLHTFRHTVATMLQDSGLSLRIAQSQMGHATERTTHRIYSHTNDEAMQRVAHTMEGIFGDVETGPLTASESV